MCEQSDPFVTPSCHCCQGNIASSQSEGAREAPAVEVNTTHNSYNIMSYVPEHHNE